MSDVEMMEKIKNIQGLLWRPFVDELLIRSKKWFQDRDHAAARIEQLERDLAKTVEALRPLIAIADAFDENELDDDARKFWGGNYEHENHKPHDQIELYSGRGGKRLLTLGDAMNARAVLAELEGKE